MKISVNSQLGLMMDDDKIKVEFLELCLGAAKGKMAKIDTTVENIRKIYDDKIGELTIAAEQVEAGEIEMTVEEVEAMAEIKSFDLQKHKESQRIYENVKAAHESDILNFFTNNGAKLYLICDGVEKCSKMIRIGDNFSSRALRNIPFGKHTYLLGKNEMCRFLCAAGAIIGIYWNRERKISFEFGFDLTTDGYYFDEDYPDEFNKVTKLITFVELGDIETVILEKGRNNGKAKSDGKITNGANYTVYVVDSSWNKLIIRTEGFAVMGHFRLQPCGAGLIDRKLIWINAFEKHGYTRRPKAEIIHQ